jgi:hypothetical protein
MKGEGLKGKGVRTFLKMRKKWVPKLRFSIHEKEEGLCENSL